MKKRIDGQVISLTEHRIHMLHSEHGLPDTCPCVYCERYRFENRVVRCLWFSIVIGGALVAIMQMVAP